MLVVEFANAGDVNQQAQQVVFQINGKKFSDTLIDGVNWILIPDEIISNLLEPAKLSSGAPNGFMFRLIECLSVDNKYVLDIFSEDNPLIEGGLHKQEKTSEGNLMRWTNGAAEIIIPYNGSADAVDILISIDAVPKPLENLITKIYINGRETGMVAGLSKGPKDFRFSVKKEFLKLGRNELEIITPPWKPSEKLGTSDGRELGIPLKSITIDYFNKNN